MYVYADKTAEAKAHWVVCSNSEYPIPPRSETFSSTPPSDINRAVIGYTAENGNQLWKMDVTQAFTQSHKFDPSIRIYMYPPPYYLPKGQVLQLLGPLYDLRRALACWSRTVRDFLTVDGWHKVVDNNDTVWYTDVRTDSSTQTKKMIVEYHINDFLISSHPSCSKALHSFKQRFMSRFDAKDEGRATRFICLDIHHVGNPSTSHRHHCCSRLLTIWDSKKRTPRRYPWFQALDSPTATDLRNQTVRQPSSSSTSQACCSTSIRTPGWTWALSLTSSRSNSATLASST